MKRSLALLVWAVLCGPALAQSPQFGDRVAACLAEKHADPARLDDREVKQCERSASLDEAKDRWHLCILKEVQRLDDGVSSSSDIGAALQNVCESEYQKFTEVAFPGRPDAQARVSDSRAQSTSALASRFVLEVRAARRKAALP